MKPDRAILLRVCVLLALWTLPAAAERDDTARIESPAVRQHGGTVFITDERLAILRSRIADRAEPTYSAWLDLEQYVQEHGGHTPSVPDRWYVPGFYVDSEGHRQAKEGLMRDANTAYAFALYFRLGGQRQYGRAAAEMVRAWVDGLESTSREDDSTLSFSYHFPAMIFAADLLRGTDFWTADDEQDFQGFLREKALPLNTMDAANNWGNWGLVLTVSIATYLDDEDLFGRCVQRWKEFIGQQIAEDGHLHHEVRRSGGRRGLWYSHFSLMPQTIAAEIMRINGTDLFGYTAPNGSSLQVAYVRLAAWCRRLETFPYWDGPVEELRAVDYYSYFEILADHWPNENAQVLLRRSRPMTARHSSPFLTLTHGDPLEDGSDR